jgi:nitroimidazol reductase NimA-like FMN-containing flavoprotein (pyridoxamine 5'-phosphate oxidase superfamily)
MHWTLHVQPWSEGVSKHLCIRGRYLEHFEVGRSQLIAVDAARELLRFIGAGSNYNPGAMQINEITQEECRAVLADASFGRLACCFENQPYVVPIHFAFEKDCLYVLSTLGQKIEWMRKNPKVCVQADRITSETHWVSVVIFGSYQELAGPQFAEERKRARALLEQRSRWWQIPLGERQSKSDDELIEPLFFRVHVATLSGLRAVG